MKKTTTTPYDVAKHLRSATERAAYLEAHIEESGGDPYWIAIALNNIARSVGMTEVSRKANVSRESLYKSLSGTGNPEFMTIVKVMAALGLRFRVAPLEPPAVHKAARARATKSAGIPKNTKAAAKTARPSR